MTMYLSPDLKKYGQKNDYIINNSFRCGLQPKRVSNDSHIYMLYHKKMLRKAVIDKRFQENVNFFYHSPEPQKAGFKGKTTRQHLSQSKPSKQRSKQREQRQFRTKKKATTCDFHIEQNPKSILLQRRKLWIPKQNGNGRPNMMSNLTLYRRGVIKNQEKPHSICIRIVGDYKKMMSQNKEEQVERRRRVQTLV